jgi:hypothetical protein
MIVAITVVVVTVVFLVFRSTARAFRWLPLFVAAGGTEPYERTATHAINARNEHGHYGQQGHDSSAYHTHQH